MMSLCFTLKMLNKQTNNQKELVDLKNRAIVCLCASILNHDLL